MGRLNWGEGMLDWEGDLWGNSPGDSPEVMFSSPLGGSGSPWGPPEPWGPAGILNLPRTPFQFAVQDPAQDAFQYPFQFPPQDPGQGNPQYAPVDVPENELQQIPGEQSFDWMQSFNPRGTLVSNAWDIGKDYVEQQGFDLGAFGAISPTDNLLGNMFRIDDWLKNNPDEPAFGDFAQSFESMSSPIQEAFSNVAQPITNMLSGTQDFFNLDWLNLETTPAPEASGSDVIPYQGGYYQVGEEDPNWVTSDPVAQQTTTIASTGIDLNAPEVMNASPNSLAGLDILGALVDMIL